MIEVRIRSFNKDHYETTLVRVHADDAKVIEHVGQGATLDNDALVLLKEGKEVAWFAAWDHAIIVDNIVETP